MAEYIDRKQIKYRKERVLDSWAGSRHTDCDVTYKTIVEKCDINNIPTADVIERSKIDKAIAEIKELYTEWENSTDEARLESNPFGAVLNITQRNIGE